MDGTTSCAILLVINSHHCWVGSGQSFKTWVILDDAQVFVPECDILGTKLCCMPVCVFGVECIFPLARENKMQWDTCHPQLPVAFTFRMTWIWFTTLMGTARLPVPVGPHGNSLLGVFQWPANIVLHSNMLDLVFHPIQKLLQWHVMWLEPFGTWLRWHHLGCTFQSWPIKWMLQAEWFWCWLGGHTRFENWWALG